MEMDSTIMMENKPKKRSVQDKFAASKPIVLLDESMIHFEQVEGTQPFIKTIERPDGTSYQLPTCPFCPPSKKNSPEGCLTADVNYWTCCIDSHTKCFKISKLTMEFLIKNEIISADKPLRFLFHDMPNCHSAVVAAVTNPGWGSFGMIQFKCNCSMKPGSSNGINYYLNFTSDKPADVFLRGNLNKYVGAVKIVAPPSDPKSSNSAPLDISAFIRKQ